ncbi:hypothetical protein [Conexibacter sp. SYSU D00693]|uniref:hypothetical protein n=1 Tax=Conexibacter sp. SYSU D00693 TaxID=2812560 RepID=UPI00196B74A5|nr:hypothetical protein [Conexibacter sp. SYSU D00693]
MSDPIFRMVCVPGALLGTPEGWAADLLTEGELVLAAGPGGLEDVDRVLHALDFWTAKVVRTEADTATQEQTVMAYTSRYALVWVAPSFSDKAREWATRRGPMTLLVETDTTLPDAERSRIERFVALLGRQAE